MKNGVILIILLAFTSLSLLAQDKNQDLGPSFILIKKNKDSKQILLIGDKITVLLKDRKIVRDKILEINHDHILTDSKRKIELTDIKWIKKTKPGTGRVVGGTILTVAGSALLIPVMAGTVDFDTIAPQ